jgi:hypothetical protein
VTLFDKYSRLISRWRRASMNGITVSVEAHATIEKLLREKGGRDSAGRHAADAFRQRQLLRLAVRQHEIEDALRLMQLEDEGPSAQGSGGRAEQSRSILLHIRLGIPIALERT